MLKLLLAALLLSSAHAMIEETPGALIYSHGLYGLIRKWEIKAEAEWPGLLKEARRTLIERINRKIEDMEIEDLKHHDVMECFGNITTINDNWRHYLKDENVSTFNANRFEHTIYRFINYYMTINYFRPRWAVRRAHLDL